MPEFQEVRVLMEDKKVGEFNRHIKEHVPYAKIVGVDILGTALALPAPEPTTAMVPSPAKRLKPTKKLKSKVGLGGIVRRRTEARQRVLNAIKAGYLTFREIADATGVGHHPGAIARQLNRLVGLGVIGGTEGSYHVLRELDKHGN